MSRLGHFKWLVAGIAAVAAAFCAGCDGNGNPSGGNGTPQTGTGFTLTVSANPPDGGSVSRDPSNSSYANGDEVIVTATAASGYVFTGWSGASTSTNTSITIKMNGNKALLANFEAIDSDTYSTITYNGNGNTGGTAPVDANSPYLNRSTVTVLDEGNLVKIGYTFLGWNTAENGNGTDYAPDAMFSITQNMRLYAKWKLDDGTHTPEPAYRAEPVAASNDPSEPRILDSWTDGEKNYYVIDVGVIRKNYISTIFGPEYYDGYHPVNVTIKNINTSTVTTSTTETVSKSIAISNTSGVKVGLEEAIKAGIPGIGDLTVKLNLEVSETVNVTNGKTTSTTVNKIESYVQSKEESRTMTFGSNGTSVGHYRYALYGISDVYFVLETSLDNQTLLSWDVISCVRHGDDDYWRHTDYSSVGNFDNSPSIDSQIVFAEDFYKTLPMPQNTLIKVERRVLTEEFTTPGTHPFTFNKGFPATIEVYVIGAGGGGQGGHYRRQWGGLFGGDRTGTGGSGGGGAAAYMKLSIEQSATFNISVGRGGSGGTGKYVNNAEWESGSPGNNGGNTSVRTGSITLTAEGGMGGGGAGKEDIDGGFGGQANPRPAGLLDFVSVAGDKGGEGAIDGDSRRRGGNAGTIEIGTGAPYGGDLGALRGGTAGTGGGGFGGYNSDQSGGSGGNGAVKIIVTYDEVL